MLDHFVPIFVLDIDPAFKDPLNQELPRILQRFLVPQLCYKAQLIMVNLLLLEQFWHGGLLFFLKAVVSFFHVAGGPSTHWGKDLRLGVCQRFLRILIATLSILSRRPSLLPWIFFNQVWRHALSRFDMSPVLLATLIVTFENTRQMNWSPTIFFRHRWQIVLSLRVLGRHCSHLGL